MRFLCCYGATSPASLSLVKTKKTVLLGSYLNSATFCLTFWSRLFDLLDEVTATRPTCGFISYADHFVICANDMWKKSSPGPGGVEVSEMPKKRMAARGLKFTDNLEALGTEVTERNSMKADEEDATLAGRQIEACTPSEHVEKMARSHKDSRYVEASWLLSSKSVARVPHRRTTQASSSGGW